MSRALDYILDDMGEENIDDMDDDEQDVEVSTSSIMFEY